MINIICHTMQHIAVTGLKFGYVNKDGAVQVVAALSNADGQFGTEAEFIRFANEFRTRLKVAFDFNLALFARDDAHETLTDEEAFGNTGYVDYALAVLALPTKEVRVVYSPEDVRSIVGATASDNFCGAVLDGLQELSVNSACMQDELEQACNDVLKERDGVLC